MKKIIGTFEIKSPADIKKGDTVKFTLVEENSRVGFCDVEVFSKARRKIILIPRGWGRVNGWLEGNLMLQPMYKFLKEVKMDEHEYMKVSKLIEFLRELKDLPSDSQIEDAITDVVEELTGLLLSNEAEEPDAEEPDEEVK